MHDTSTNTGVKETCKSKLVFKTLQICIFLKFGYKMLPQKVTFQFQDNIAPNVSNFMDYIYGKILHIILCKHLLQ